MLNVKDGKLFPRVHDFCVFKNVIEKSYKKDIFIVLFQFFFSYRKRFFDVITFKCWWQNVPCFHEFFCEENFVEILKQACSNFSISNLLENIFSMLNNFLKFKAKRLLTIKSIQNQNSLIKGKYAIEYVKYERVGTNELFHWRTSYR